MGYDKDITKGPKPFGMSIFDEPLVLFRDNSNALQCVSDLCPHRASKLSEGQVRNVLESLSLKTPYQVQKQKSVKSHF